MPDIYTYKKSIDARVVEAVEKVLHTTVLSAEKVKLGEINHVYKILTPEKKYIARVFRYRDFPQTGKLQWIEKQLAKLKVPYAKTVYYSRDNTYFPNGFMISELIEGLTGTEAVKTKLLTEAQLYFKLGVMARKIHTVRLKKYGAINNGKGEHADFIKMQLNGISKILNDLTKKKALAQNPYPLAEMIINREIKKFETRLHPVLLHGDMSESNIIIYRKKGIVLVDWDNARSGIWLADFIELARRHMTLKDWKNNQARRLNARKAFFKGYGKVLFTPLEIANIEHAMQLIRQVWQMNYYYFDRKDMKNFEIVKKIFYRLLTDEQ